MSNRFAIFILMGLFFRDSLCEGALLAGKSLGCGVSRLGWARVQHQDNVTSHSSDSSFDSGTSSGGGWVQAQWATSLFPGVSNIGVLFLNFDIILEMLQLIDYTIDNPMIRRYQ